MRRFTPLMLIVLVATCGLTFVLVGTGSHRDAGAVSDLVATAEVRVVDPIAIGPITIDPSPDAPAVPMSAAVQLLDKSRALELIRSSVSGDLRDYEVYEGLVSDRSMTEIPSGLVPSPSAEVDAPPVLPLRAAPAIVVVFRDVAWLGLHGVNPIYYGEEAPPKTETAVKGGSNVVVAFDSASGAFLFLRAFASE
jgi:hypothetical protein